MYVFGPNMVRPALPVCLLPPPGDKVPLLKPLLIFFASHSTQSVYDKDVYFAVTIVNSHIPVGQWV